VKNIINLEMTPEEVTFIWNLCIVAQDKVTDMKTAANLEHLQDRLAGAIYEAQL
jgi:hypothetical protein